MVMGSVTFEDGPVKMGFVQLFPKDGKEPVSRGHLLPGW